MMVGLWDIVVGEGMLVPARLLAALRLRDRLAPPAALRHARSCTCSPSSPTSPCSAEGWVYAVDPGRRSWACSVAALLGRWLPLAAAADRPLLRDDHRLDRRSASGTAGAGARPAAGRRRREPAEPRRSRHPHRRARPWSCSRPFLLAAAIAIKLGSRGPVIYRQRRVGRDGARVRDAQAADDGARARTRSGSARSSPATTRGSPAPGASCAAPRSTSCRTWSTCCAARWRSSARDRRSRPRSSTTPRASTAATRSCPGSPAGPRSRAAPASPGRSGSSSTSGTSSTAPPALDLRILVRTVWLVVSGQGLAPD